MRTTKYRTSDENSLLTDMHRYLGDQIDIQIEYIKTIPREFYGKFREIASRINQQEHENYAVLSSANVDGIL